MQNSNWAVVVNNFVNRLFTFVILYLPLKISFTTNNFDFLWLWVFIIFIPFHEKLDGK